MKIVVMVIADDTKDEDPVHTLVAHSETEVMQMFRDQYAESIEDWAWMSNSSLIERINWRSHLKIVINEHEI